jgi:hypothetical protein
MHQLDQIYYCVLQSPIVPLVLFNAAISHAFHQLLHVPILALVLRTPLHVVMAHVFFLQPLVQLNLLVQFPLQFFVLLILLVVFKPQIVQLLNFVLFLHLFAALIKVV